MYLKILSFRIPSLSVYYSMNISVTPNEKMIAIRPQDKWICASECDADHVSWSCCRYRATNQSAFCDEEARFWVPKVPDGLTECMPVCMFGFLRQIWRYVLVVYFFVERKFQISNKTVKQTSLICGIAILIQSE